MKLDEYVRAVLQQNAHPTAFPPKLIIDSAIANDFFALYEEGEARGIEVGYNMKFQHNQAMIDKSQKFDGGPYFIDIPPKPTAMDFADLHSHPAAAIGHIDGYCAHSLQDVRWINNHTQKPLFIRFVASGDEVYAMIYRSGHSQIDLNWLLDNIAQQGLDQQDFFLQQLGKDEDWYNDTKSGFDDEQKFQQWRMETMQSIRGLGPRFQKLSIQYCKQAANTMHLGFYHGDRWLIGRTFNTDLTLDLLAS